jgi:hypothetical protein
MNRSTDPQERGASIDLLDRAESAINRGDRATAPAEAMI